ncbi:MAG: phage tail protein I [Pseudomonadota bacterium]
MTDVASLLPPLATAQERALEQTIAATFNIDVDIARLWNPLTCPAPLLPWLAWGLSIDLWDADWSEATKRAAIADAIPFQQRKGTRASLRTVLDRFDPLIAIVEWFEANPTMEPHTFRLELPLPADSDVTYDEALVAALLRDIAAVKPVRSHMQAVFTLRAQTAAFLAAAAQAAMFVRLDVNADTEIEAAWATYLQTEIGEPILDETGAYLEAD